MPDTRDTSAPSDKRRLNAAGLGPGDTPAKSEDAAMTAAASKTCGQCQANGAQRRYPHQARRFSEDVSDHRVESIRPRSVARIPATDRRDRSLRRRSC